MTSLKNTGKQKTEFLSNTKHPETIFASFRGKILSEYSLFCFLFFFKFFQSVFIYVQINTFLTLSLNIKFYAVEPAKSVFFIYTKVIFAFHYIHHLVYEIGILQIYHFGILLSRVIIVKANTRIKELREQKGITQLKMAMDLNMNQNTISRYESGVHQADYNTLIAIADYFGVSIDYILMRTDNPKLNK